MLAGVYREVGVIMAEEVPEPQPIAGDVIVEVAACGVCGSDLETLRSGAYVSPGQVLGHEFGGTVLDTGGVLGLAEGDVVAVRPLPACGDCPSCHRGDPQLCERATGKILGYDLPGGYAERVRVPSAKVGFNVHVLPRDLDPALAALIEPLAVSLRGTRHAKVRPGDAGIVYGLGQIGLGAVAMAVQAGAVSVVAVDPSLRRRDAARELGASVVVDPTERDPVEVIRDISTADGRGPASTIDFALECSGVPSSFASALRVLRPGGRLVLLAPSAREFTLNAGSMVEKELTVLGSYGYRQEMAAVVTLVASGRLDLTAFVSHRIALRDIDTAFAIQADAASSLKVLVQP